MPAWSPAPCCSFVWALVVGPLWRGSSSGSFAQSVEIAYPVTDIAMATVAILVLRSSRAIDRRALQLVSAGFLVMAATDTVYTWMVNTATFASSSPVALGWPLGISSSQRRAGRPTVTQHHEPASVDSRASILLPYAPLLVAATIAVPKFIDGGDGLGPFLSFDALLLVAIVVAARASRRWIYAARSSRCTTARTSSTTSLSTIP